MRTVLWGLAVAMLLPIVAAASYLAQGSLEMFPTEAQDEQVRLACGVVLATAVLLELAIAAWLIRTRRRR